MSFRMRPARGEDFDAIYRMAQLTGGGSTNLPADKGTLVAKLARSDVAFSGDTETPTGDLFIFVLENAETGAITGTCRCSAGSAASSLSIPTGSASSPRPRRSSGAPFTPRC